MTERQAAAYISGLTLEEKLKLHDLLLALEQRRQPEQAHQAKEKKGDE